MSRVARGLTLLLSLVVATAQARDHVDARDYPTPGAGRAAFERMEQDLVRGFDDICGDTFCEGEFFNLRALQLRCAVAAEDGTVAGCLWSFAGSDTSVLADAAVPQVHARTYACALPLAPGTPLDTLLRTLVGRGALHTPLPGTRSTSYDGLIGCL